MINIKTYNIFDLNQLKLEGNFDDALIYSDDTTLNIKGYSHIDSPLNLCWYSEDIFNHSYFKYRTQNNLTGLEVEFEIDTTNCISYQDEINNPLNLIIDFNESEAIKIPLGFFSNTDIYSKSMVFDGELGKEYLLKSGVTFIKRDVNKDIKDNVKISWTYKEQNGELSSSEFDVDYVSGDILIKENHLIKNGATLNINIVYHKSNTNYSINFSNIYSGVSPLDENYKRVDTTDVKSVKFEIASNVDNFTYKIFNLTTKLSELNTSPSALKSNDLYSGEDYDLVYKENPILLVNSLKNLGYNNFTLKLGKDKFLNKNNILGPLKSSFLNWLELYLKELSNINVNEVNIIISMDMIGLPKHWYQVNGNMEMSTYLSPLNKEVFNFIGQIISNISTINTNNLKINYLLDGFEFKTLNDSLCIYDEAIQKLLTDNEVEKEDSNIYINNALNDILRDYYNTYDVLPITTIDNLLYKELQNATHNTIDYTKYLVNNILEFIKEVIDNEKISISLDHTNIDINDFNLTSTLLKIDLSIDRFIIYFDRLDSDDNLVNNWEDINDFIFSNLYSNALGGICVLSGKAIRDNSCFIYKPMTYVEMKKVDVDNELILCRANKEIIGYLTNSKIDSITRSITDPDEINFTVPFWIYDRFSHQKIKNPLWDYVIEERLILLNNEEYFVIKQVSDYSSDGRHKELTCYSLEHKLTKSEVVINEKSLQLYSDNGEDDGILNLLFKDTGWNAGYVDSTLKFEKNGNTTVSKYRWFESVDNDWLTFLTDEVSKSFDCIFQFDTYNRLVNVYNASSITKNRGLYLSKDNYIKSKQVTGSTSELTTRLRCYGKDEISISTVSLNGLDYIEDYSYFIEIGDMSLELQKALSDYNIIASSVNEKWKATNNDYLLNYSNLTTLNGDKVKLEAEIETLENIKKTYEDLLEKEENKEEDNPTTYEDTIEENPKNEIDVINEQIEKAKEELQKVNTSITLIEEQINTLKESLENMTLQLDKTTTTYEDGSLVFNEKLLYELSEFIYWDTYSDDKYDSAESLLEGASREMAHRCKPTIEYEIESVNFLEQLLNAKNKYWNETLYLGDLITLYDNEVNKEEVLFFVGYTLNPMDKALEIKLSNKKLDTTSTKKISELLTKTKRVTKKINKNQYLWNRVKNQ